MSSSGFLAVSVTISIAFLTTKVTSDVICPYKSIVTYYPAPNRMCEDIEGAWTTREICAFHTCADLLDHHENTRCCQGKCDATECICYHGCIQLDSWGYNETLKSELAGLDIRLSELFLKRYEGLVDPEQKIEVSSGNVLNFGHNDPLMTTKALIGTF